jgi:DNA-directed RNA polymerase subunit F
MIVLNKTPLTLAEIKQSLPTQADSEDPEKTKQIKDYLKTFSTLNVDKAKSLSEEIQALNNVKIKQEDIVKVADLLPVDKEDVNKIFSDVSLTEEEANAIAEIVKKYK